MTDALTLDFLMKGGWFALEQAGRLIHDAHILFKAGSHVSAAGLALLSREELAKSGELFSLWMEADRGATVTREDAIARIERMTHEQKQHRGASSFNIPIDELTRSVLVAGRDAAPAQFDEVSKRLQFRIERIMKSAPSDRTDRREQSFYVDASPQNDSWRRPADMLHTDAAHILDEARQDYWQQHSCPGISARVPDLEHLHAALASWGDKPQLSPAEFNNESPSR